MAGHYACAGWRWKADLPLSSFGNLSGLKRLLETGKVLVIPLVTLVSRVTNRDENLAEDKSGYEYREVQARDRLHDLHRFHAGESLAGPDVGGVQPEILFRQCRRS